MLVGKSYKPKTKKFKVSVGRQVEQKYRLSHSKMEELKQQLTYTEIDAFMGAIGDLAFDMGYDYPAV